MSDHGYRGVWPYKAPPRQKWESEKDVQATEDGWVGGLRWLKRHLPWLSVALPPPSPATHGSVTLLDSARL